MVLKEISEEHVNKEQRVIAISGGRHCGNLI